MEQEIQAVLARNVARITGSTGVSPTPVPGVRCTKVSKPDALTRRRWHACLAFVIQGAKDLTVGRTVYHLTPGKYTATPLDLPALSRFVTASADRPFLAVLIEWQPRLLSELAKPLTAELGRASAESGQAVFIGESDAPMRAALVRLTELFARPRDAAALGPLVIRELFYHLLRSPSGAAVHHFARAGSKTNRMQRAIHTLHSDLSEAIDVTALAQTAGISRAGFFKAFKEMTAVSPIQYQKRLRLLEAQRLMLEEEATAESSAFQVGYQSATQFSREYSRLFGMSPRRHAEKLGRRAR